MMDKLKEYWINFVNTKDGDIIIRTKKLALRGVSVVKIDEITVSPEKKYPSKNMVKVTRISIGYLLDDYVIIYTNQSETLIARKDKDRL